MKKINLISKVIYAVYAISYMYFIYIRDFSNLIISIICTIGTYLLVALNKKYPKLFEETVVSVLVVFIMCAVLFGTCLGAYDINHFDDFLHLWSGFIACAVGYVFVKYFLDCEFDTVKKKVFLAVFLFMFSMGVASLWEIIEYFMDSVLGMKTQVGGLVDTMSDMIDCFIGAFLMTGYYLFKERKEAIVK